MTLERFNQISNYCTGSDWGSKLTLRIANEIIQQMGLAYPKRASIEKL
jgi:hypothetical protein